MARDREEVNDRATDQKDRDVDPCHLFPVRHPDEPKCSRGHRRQHLGHCVWRRAEHFQLLQRVAEHLSPTGALQILRVRGLSPPSPLGLFFYLFFFDAAGFLAEAKHDRCTGKIVVLAHLTFEVPFV